MGCDIHVRVEYFGPDETVVLKDGAVAVAATGSGSWRPAEKVSRNGDWIRYTDLLAGKNPGEWPTTSNHNGEREPLPRKVVEEWLAETPEFSLDYHDRYYSGRNYALFFKLAGVRGRSTDIFPILMQTDDLDWTEASNYAGRGLPPDVSAEVGEDLSEDDLDLHTHGWFSLTELLAVDWSDLVIDGLDMASDFRQGCLTQMEALAIWKCGGDTDRVRMIFAFDN